MMKIDWMEGFWVVEECCIIYDVIYYIVRNLDGIVIVQCWKNKFFVYVIVLLLEWR